MPAPKKQPGGKRSGDYTESSGRDHPSQSEHTHTDYEKLHGESDRRLKDKAVNGSPPPPAERPDKRPDKRRSPD